MSKIGNNNSLARTSELAANIPNDKKFEEEINQTATEKYFDNTVVQKTTFRERHTGYGRTFLAILIIGLIFLGLFYAIVYRAIA